MKRKRQIKVRALWVLQFIFDPFLNLIVCHHPINNIGHNVFTLCHGPVP